MTLGICLCATIVVQNARGDEPLRSVLDSERIETRINDRLLLTGQGRTEKQQDLQISKVATPVVKPSTSVRAGPDGSALRERKTKRVAASQN